MDEERRSGSEHFEGSINLERDVEDYLVNNLGCLERGLVFKNRQVKTDVGVIDILARDKDGNTVIIELKVGEAGDSAVGQITRYMGWFEKNMKPMTPRRVRGMLVANQFSEGAKYSASLLPALTLLRCKLSFNFEIET